MAVNVVADQSLRALDLLAEVSDVPLDAPAHGLDLDTCRGPVLLGDAHLGERLQPAGERL
jgi:hypothetical protein